MGLAGVRRAIGGRMGGRDKHRPLIANSQEPGNESNVESEGTRSAGRVKAEFVAASSRFASGESKS